MSKLLNSMLKLLKIQKGATAIEYALIAALLSVALVGGYRAVGGGYVRIYNNIASSI